MSWKIWKKSKLNSEKIWKIQKKNKLNSEKIWKIWKKGKLNSEMIWKISVLVIITPKENSFFIPFSSSTSSAAAVAAVAIALKFHPKHEKRLNLRQNKTHYENITH
jgi:hypothetical protein